MVKEVLLDHKVRADNVEREDIQDLKGIPGTIIDYAYIYNNEPQVINPNDNLMFNNPIITSSGIAYSSGNILIINRGIYKLTLYTFLPPGNQVSVFLNGVILNQGIFNDNYGQCIFNVPTNTSTINIVNTASVSLNLLLPTSNGTQLPINTSIIIERYF